jgi:hypothetical protein
MIPEQPKTQNYQPTDGRRYYNYVLLHTLGLGHVFDTMRYDDGFLVRRTDLDNLLAAAADYLPWSQRRLSLLLCRPDWKGPTKANWTEGRLLSTQEYERIEDWPKLFSLCPDATINLSFSPKKPLKFIASGEITGTLAQVLEVMFFNQAAPDDEHSTHKMYDALYRPEDTITVNLRSFVSEERTWDVSPLEKKAVKS